MDMDFTTKAGIQKLIVTIAGILGTTLITTFGWSPDKTNVIVTLLTQFAPIIATVLFYVVNQIAAQGKATTAQKVLETKVAMIETLAESAPDVAMAIVAPMDNFPFPVEETLPVPKDWNLFKQEVKDKVDDELREQLAFGLIVGVPATNVSRAEARKLVPILSSDNPSRIWTRTQQYAMSTEATMAEALDFYKNALLPAAEAALIDQQGTVLSSGKTCDWPPSFMAVKWIAWCRNNIASIEKNISEKVYNLNGDNAWNIGEISDGIINKRIAVNTTYKNGVETKHFYPETNWY